MTALIGKGGPINFMFSAFESVCLIVGGSGSESITRYVAKLTQQSRSGSALRMACCGTPHKIGRKPSGCVSSGP